MSLKVETINLLQQYLAGVMGRAGHHAGEVNGVVLALVGAVIWKKDADSEITVRQYKRANLQKCFVRFH